MIVLDIFFCSDAKFLITTIAILRPKFTVVLNQYQY